ncbi:hypothetical protein [Caulobacter sp.]|uniref:hypothetical protein n=1 Tax=Caulobacter sp. TaxID=78 RepID=UPI003BAC10FA
MTELKEIYPGRYQTSGERREDEPVSSMILLAPSACVGDHDSRRIYIPSSEILRFYFGPISWLADSFMSAVYGAPGDGLFDPEETRFIEPGVFQIAPVAGLADRASALHLALLLNSPDLLQLWQEASDASLGSERREGGIFRSTLMLPEGKHSLALLGKNSSVERFMLVAQERAFVASAIISDYRPAPFSKLVVKLPYGMNESDAGNIDDASYNPRTRHNTVVALDAKLEARRRPGIQVARLSPHHESLRRTFPGLSRVAVQYDVASLARNQPREVERRIRMVEALSALSPGSDPKVGGVLFRPSKAYFPPAQLERPSRRLFEAISTEAGRFESFAVTELKYPLSVFVKAMNRLSRHQSGGLVAQDPLQMTNNLAMLMVGNPSWNSMARGRRIAIGRIDVDGRSVYAFEMSRRRASESISLGLVAKVDGSQMSIIELSRVVEHATQQMGSRGSNTEGRNRGVWPGPDAFRDITGRIVAHTAKRRFASVLAEELDGLARSLFDLDQPTSAAA